MQHIHTQGLVHRDLKPANLMLIGSVADTTVRATVKLLDIGLGRVMFEETGEAETEGLTGEGVLLGTPDYMAPEQARDPRTADIRSDIYSMGCVLYHALAGQPPFPDTNIISQMIRHATEPPRPLKELNPAVPDGLQPIVNWMLAKDPAGRYPTPERAAQALQMYLAATAEPLHAPESDPSMQSYLSWLVVEGEKAPTTAAAAAALAASPTIPSLQVAQPRPLVRRPRAAGATSRPRAAGACRRRPSLGQAAESAQAGPAARRGRQAQARVRQAPQQEEASLQAWFGCRSSAGRRCASRGRPAHQRRAGAAAAGVEASADGGAAVQPTRFRHLRDRRRRRRFGDVPRLSGRRAGQEIQPPPPERRTRINRRRRSGER